MNFLSGRFDERFLVHRLRATSVAAMAGGGLAMALFAWHCWADHVWNWELFSVGLTMAVVKQGLMFWYCRTN